MKNCFLTLSAIALLMLPLVLFSQDNGNLAGVRSIRTWQPVKITSEGSNIVNGVEFYKKTELCSGQEVVIVKVNNKNNYPVNIQWKDALGNPEKLTINEVSQIEGSCESYLDKTGTNDKDKLAMLVPDKETKKVILSTLTVTEVNK